MPTDAVWNSELANFYSAWALEYTQRFSTELNYKPLDRQLLLEFALQTLPGPVGDLSIADTID